MKYYKDTNNETFIDPILANHTGLVEITSEEFQALANPPKTAEQFRDIAKAELKTARETALADNEYALPDGSVFQVRPSDLGNFQLAIQGGVAKNWILKDDTVRLTTIAELSEVMTAGIAQAEVIWDAYALDLGSL